MWMYDKEDGDMYYSYASIHIKSYRQLIRVRLTDKSIPRAAEKGYYTGVFPRHQDIKRNPIAGKVSRIYIKFHQR